MLRRPVSSFLQEFNLLPPTGEPPRFLPKCHPRCTPSRGHYPIEILNKDSCLRSPAVYFDVK